MLTCPATVTTDATGAPLCLDGTSAAVAWQVTPEFDPSQIDPLLGSQYFAAGFVIVGICWALGKAVRTVLATIGK